MKFDTKKMDKFLKEAPPDWFERVSREMSRRSIAAYQLKLKEDNLMSQSQKNLISAFLDVYGETEEESEPKPTSNRKQ